MSDAAVEKNDAVVEEVTSSEPKESPVKKSPAKKVPETPESNGKQHDNGDAAEAPVENGDAEEAVTENGDATDKKEAGVKRKSIPADNGDAGDAPDAGEVTTPEKKPKVAEEAPSAPEEAAV